MSFADMDPNTDIPELWKNTLPNNPKVEQYRLRCISPMNLMDDQLKSSNYSKYDAEPNDRNYSGHPQVTVRHGFNVICFHGSSNFLIKFLLLVPRFFLKNFFLTSIREGS